MNANRPDSSLTDRLFWPVIGLISTAILFLGVLFATARSNKPTTPVQTSVQPPSTNVSPATVPQSEQTKVVTPTDDPSTAIVIPAQVSPEYRTPKTSAYAPYTSTKSSSTEMGTNGPRGPPAVNGVAENGSYYGETSTTTGKPKTVEVQGYYRKDGTYVRGYYRSK